MKKKVIVFRCDNCGKEEQTDRDELPYNKEWFLVRGYNFGVPNMTKNAMVNHGDIVVNEPLHFCSRKCFSKHLTSEIEKAMKGQSTPVMEQYDGDSPNIDDMPGGSYFEDDDASQLPISEQRTRDIYPGERRTGNFLKP